MYKMSKNSEKRKYSRRQIKKKIFLSAFSEKKKKKMASQLSAKASNLCKIHYARNESSLNNRVNYKCNPLNSRGFSMKHPFVYQMPSFF